METASRENDEKVERIQRKLDEAILQQQKDKKTNEETLDAFQADIDALEKEKQDLKVRNVQLFYFVLVVVSLDSESIMPYFFSLNVDHHFSNLFISILCLILLFWEFLPI